MVGEYNVGQEFDCCPEGDNNCSSSSDDSSPPCAPAQKFELDSDDVIIHEGWDVNNALEGNDIALIRLPSLVETQAQNEKYVRLLAHTKPMIS